MMEWMSFAVLLVLVSAFVLMFAYGVGWRARHRWEIRRDGSRCLHKWMYTTPFRVERDKRRCARCGRIEQQTEKGSDEWVEA